MRYLQANKTYMINLDTFTFVRIDSQFGKFELAVPMYLWRYNSSTKTTAAVGVAGESYKTLKLPLNKFCLEFTGGFEYAVLHFAEQVDKIELRITTITYLYNNQMTDETQELLVGSFCRMKHGGVTKQIQIEFDEDKENKPRFHYIHDLGRIEKMAGDALSWGISPNKYEVIYKGRTICKCLAIMCGVWCVLLTDRLEFDSVALLNAVDNKKLYIEQFLYSVNSGIVKAMVLLK